MLLVCIASVRAGRRGESATMMRPSTCYCEAVRICGASNRGALASHLGGRTGNQGWAWARRAKARHTVLVWQAGYCGGRKTPVPASSGGGGQSRQGAASGQAEGQEGGTHTSAPPHTPSPPASGSSQEPGVNTRRAESTNEQTPTHRVTCPCCSGRCPAGCAQAPSCQWPMRRLGPSPARSAGRQALSPPGPSGNPGSGTRGLAGHAGHAALRPACSRRPGRGCQSWRGPCQQR